jgi:adenosylcobyric acid synthase
MLQGASSSVGKSLLTTALCRLYARRGVRVAPFKAQNMSNNAAVTPDGGEIGRAQAVQAMACGLEPHTDMNPILLKPEADSRSQVIVNGRPLGSLPARDYYALKRSLWEAARGALERLREQYDLVIIEGAGSPAELNLYEDDIVNMAVARHADAPVLLIGDVDRGGVFAQLLGTLMLLPEQERVLIRGLIVNKFRGDPTLFAGGVRILEERSGLPVLGVVPWLPEAGLAEEDGAVLEGERPVVAGGFQIDVAVIRLPRISNFDDVDPLALEPGVRVRYVNSPETLGTPDAIIVPGTKSTAADLAWLDKVGLTAAIRAHVARGVALVGICGGYQMLGETIRDPCGVEGAPPEVRGLGLLPVRTTFARRKATHRVAARLAVTDGFLGAVGDVPLVGYEIHAGLTEGAEPLFWLTRHDSGETVPDGATGHGGRVLGTCLHGLFDNDSFRWAWLRSLGWDGEGSISALGARLAAIDRLADHVAAALDMACLDAIIERGIKVQPGIEF